MTTSCAASRESLKKTVLLVDDESALMVLFEMELTRLGYRVITAHNGSAASRIGSDLNLPIDVLITDWKMPDITGDVLARHLMDGQPTLAVIFMSGYDEAEAIAKTFDPARVTFLRKPFSLALLDQTLRILLGLPVHNRLVA